MNTSRERTSCDQYQPFTTNYQFLLLLLESSTLHRQVNQNRDLNLIWPIMIVGLGTRTARGIVGTNWKQNVLRPISNTFIGIAMNLKWSKYLWNVTIWKPKLQKLNEKNQICGDFIHRNFHFISRLSNTFYITLQGLPKIKMNFWSE